MQSKNLRRRVGGNNKREGYLKAFKLINNNGGQQCKIRTPWRPFLLKAPPEKHIEKAKRSGGIQKDEDLICGLRVKMHRKKHKAQP